MLEAERAFSAAGLFATKLRSRPDDKSVNALSFLRSNYMKQNLSKLDAFVVCMIVVFVLLYSNA